ncbi:MAG: SUMF1/EgtB/PvdO family nonheme iron enzyme, partial [Anaerolineae bacterium]|nr:SUMF1/EgtB/PvdO family nonheme iron enzyme [Anaerolineae bacterium]
MARVFLSYNSQDRPFILMLAEQLVRAEHDVWLDVWRISGRVPYWEEIKAGIEQCTHFLFAISPESIRPESGTRVELDHAAGLPPERRPIIVPILVRETDLNSLPITISPGRLHIHDFVHKPYEAMLSNVLHALAERDSAERPRRALNAQQRQFGLRFAESLALMRNGAYEQAIDLLEALSAEGYQPRFFSLQVVIDHARHSLYQQQRRREAQEAYEEIAALRHMDLELARKAWLEFRRNYPEFTDDPLDLNYHLRPRAKTSTLKPDVSDILPNFAWCDVTEGHVFIDDATDPRKYNPSGSGGGISHVSAFKIAQTPITNAQYQVFLDAPDGYRDIRWWTYSLQATAWRRKRPQPKPAPESRERFPRTRVSWFDAVAFCIWLSYRTGKQITLPTELQWQRAAQGDDNRRYPYGKDFDPKRCNTRESGIGAPTPVDAYPNGKSPFGVLDMQGNVWEWCLTEWQTDATHLDGNMPRVLRGGAWSSEGRLVTNFYRYQGIPSIELDSVGFRPVL